MFIDPFCGGCNVIDDVQCATRIASDISLPLIELFKAVVVRGQELPIEISKELYNDVKRNRYTGKYPQWMIGAVGYLASYNGKMFCGHANAIKTRAGVRYYYDEAKRNIENQASKLRDVRFECCDYVQYSDVRNAVIYCDIPYENVTQYQESKKFDYARFWDWCRHVSQNNRVFISEQQAPPDFFPIWSQQVTRTSIGRTVVVKTEKLFVLNWE
jgi:DNA adenine methylase